MKCRTIKFRCSESEKERIEGMSREAGTTISEYCRQQSLSGRILANRRLSPDEITYFKALKEHNNALARMANLIRNKLPGLAEAMLDKVVGRNMVDGDDPVDILREFEMVNQHNYRCKNKYLRFEIGIAPQDRDKLAPGDMTRIAGTFAHRMGLDNHQWVACTHKDTGKPHIHLIANRIGVDGKVFDTTFMSNRSARIAEELSRDMGLTIANEVRAQKPHYPRARRRCWVACSR